MCTIEALGKSLKYRQSKHWSFGKKLNGKKKHESPGAYLKNI
jgi:hypothetical protein